MKLKYLLAAASLIAAAFWLHGDFPLTAATEIALIVSTLAVLAWFEPRCVEVEWEEWRRRPPSAAAYRRLEWTFKLFAICGALIYGAFLLHYGSLEEFFERSQQEALVTQVDHQMAAGQHRAAAQSAETHLKRRLHASTRSRLQFRLLECWLAIAERSNKEQRAAVVEHAELLAQEGLIDQAAVATLRRYVDRLATIAAHNDQLAQLSQSGADALDGERKARHAAEANLSQQADQFQLQIKEASQKLAVLHREHAARHFGTLVAWGDSLSADLPLQRDKYQEAIDFAQPWQFEKQAAEERLRIVREAIRQMQPQDLPHGSSARWLTLNRDWLPPVLSAELMVLDSQGQSIEGLQTKDFRIAINGQPASAIAAVQLLPTQQRPQVAILVDCSGSAAGPALAAAKAGICHLLAQLRGQADVCVIAFNTTASLLAPWDADFQVLERRLADLQAAGGTGIYTTLDMAATVLQPRANPRLVVLFTDGKDSTGIQPNRVIERLRAEQIVVHAVGLETTDFDRAAIERLTTSTGGTLLTASQAPELAARFAELSQTLNTPRYRLVIPAAQAAGKLQITIGGQNAAVLETSLETATATPLAKQ